MKEGSATLRSVETSCKVAITSPLAVTPGSKIRSASSDTFVLGDETRVYYDDGDPLTAGESDFALIADFDPSQDFIQLNGTPDVYRLDFFTSELGTIDADLIFDPGVTARGEVIATLQDVSTDLSVTDPSFTFV